MHTIHAINVNDAYIQGLHYLAANGEPLQTRNGAALVAPEPVTTRYAKPLQRVLFDSQRDANPFFHLFEALWILSGRNDLKTPAHFLPSFAAFSDDGRILHGAYGHRLRKTIIWGDQLATIIALLKATPTDRRAIAQIWDAEEDLAENSKDIPCNDMIKFRIRHDALEMYVFNRSNDAIWGCYGANVVHFSMIQEYMASMIGVGVGPYEQISTDFHAYQNTPYRFDAFFPMRNDDNANPYADGEFAPYPLVQHPETFDDELTLVTQHVRDGTLANIETADCDNTFFHYVAQPMYRAHRLYRSGDVDTACKFIEHAIQRQLLDAPFIMDDHSVVPDWLVAGMLWLRRRRDKKLSQQYRLSPDTAQRA